MAFIVGGGPNGPQINIGSDYKTSVNVWIAPSSLLPCNSYTASGDKTLLKLQLGKTATEDF